MNILKETKDRCNVNKKSNLKLPSKKDVVIFLIVFALNLAMCSAFLQPHYPHETYKIMHIGYAEYSKSYFLKEGRPFTAILSMLMGILNVPVEVYGIVSFVIAIILLSISIVIVYKLFKEKIGKDSKLINIILILSSFLVIMNYFEIEYIFFIECAIMALAMLLSVIIAKININDEKNKYVKSFLLGLVVVFCYQGALAIFPIIVLTYKLLLQKHTIKENIKEIVKISFIYIVLMLITIIYSKVLFGGSRVQMGAATVTFTEIISWAKSLAIDSLGVIPSFVHIGFIIFTTILILIFYNNKKEKALFTLKYLFIILYAIVMSLAPIVGGSGLELTPRTCIAYSCTIGISLFILLWIILQNNKKYQLNLLAVITIITFALNFMLYVIITNQHLKVNKLDKENCLKIEKVIEKYEEVNNTKITKIATIRRTDSNQYYPGFIHAGTLTRKALNTWPVRETIVFYTGRKLEFTAFPMEIYKEHFSGLEFEDFSLRQVVIKGDTLYFYGG